MLLHLISCGLKVEPILVIFCLFKNSHALLQICCARLLDLKCYGNIVVGNIMHVISSSPTYRSSCGYHSVPGKSHGIGILVNSVKLPRPNISSSLD